MSATGGHGRVELRPARLDDASLFFTWRNDPFLVARSTSRRPVAWDEHMGWLRSVLDDPDRLLFVVQAEGREAGQVRFERLDIERAVISVYLAEPFTGRGLGVRAIQLGCVEAFARWPIREVLACIRDENRPGLSGFAKAGFKTAPGSRGCPVEHRALVRLRTDHGSHGGAA